MQSCRLCDLVWWIKKISKTNKPFCLPRKCKQQVLPKYLCTFTNLHGVMYQNIAVYTFTIIKAIPLQTWTGHEGSRSFRLPDFHDIRHKKLVRLSASRTGRLFPQEMLLVLIFTRGWFDPRAMVRSEGNMSLKNPVTPPGIDPGTVRLVAQGLNHYATPGHFRL